MTNIIIILSMEREVERENAQTHSQVEKSAQSVRDLQRKQTEKLEQKEMDGYRLLQQQAASYQQLSSPPQQPQNYQQQYPYQQQNPYQQQPQYHQYQQQYPYQQQNMLAYQQPYQQQQLAYQPAPPAPEMDFQQQMAPGHMMPTAQPYMGFHPNAFQYQPAAQHMQPPQQGSGMGYLPPPPPPPSPAPQVD